MYGPSDGKEVKDVFRCPSARGGVGKVDKRPLATLDLGARQQI